MRKGNICGRGGKRSMFTVSWKVTESREARVIYPEIGEIVLVIGDEKNRRMEVRSCSETHQRQRRSCKRSWFAAQGKPNPAGHSSWYVPSKYRADMKGTRRS